jgi:hypothetical protein
MEYILRDIEITREKSPSTEKIPKNTQTKLSSRFFGYAAVGRFNIISAGGNFKTIVAALEKEGKKQKTIVFQFFLNLSEPWVGDAVEILRKRGYFFGGCVPRWFDADGLLMQKLLRTPDFKAPHLHSAKAKKMLKFIRADWQDLQG